MQFLTTAILTACSYTALTLASPACNTGQTAVLDGISYYIPPKPVASLKMSFLDGKMKISGLTPLTIVTTNNSNYNSEDFRVDISNFTSADDVFSPGFVKFVFVQYTSRTYGRRSIPIQMSQMDNMTDAVWGSQISPDTAIAPGPYFLSPTGAVHEAWRLYSDHVGAFSETVFPGPDGSFSVLPANVPGQAFAVAVPSRLYHTKSADKPLAGVRFGIKDIYDIAGIKTSNGNRAWYRLYPEANQTATVVKRLIDAGAIIVGKMVTSQFANGESPTADWVDHPSPFNPRGDGYQSPSSSSSGPAAAVAAYEWLDVALGSDTGGSIRGPAGVQGVYGNRPTHGLVELSGVMPLAPELDTPGFLTRDPYLWATAAEVMYRDNITFTSAHPAQIFASGFPTNVTDPGDQLLIDFIDRVTALLETNITTYNITSEWSIARPGGVNASLESYMNHTYPIIISQQQARLVRDPFYSDYAAVYDGRKPFINPAPLARWSWGDSYPPIQLVEENHRREIFADWFANDVLVAGGETCSNGFFFYVGSKGDVDYRNRYVEPPTAPTGWGISRVSPYWGGPDFVVPIGEVAYFSDITQHEEYLPVTVDIMAARGCDGLIYSFIQRLIEAGILKNSVSGRSSVDGGDILVRRNE